MVPALSVHGFRFSRDIQGHVLSLALPLAAASGHTGGGEKPRLDALFESIAQEYCSWSLGAS